MPKLIELDPLLLLVKAWLFEHEMQSLFQVEKYLLYSYNPPLNPHPEF